MQNPRNLRKEEIVSLCSGNAAQSGKEVYAAAFAAYSLYGWSEVWFQRGMQESAGEMRELFLSQRP